MNYSNETNVQLWIGDCLDLMKDIPDHSVDAIICDLPYGSTTCKWDSAIPLEPLWIQYKRIIKVKGAIVLFGSQPFTTKLIMSNMNWFKYCFVWDKVRGVGHLNAKIKPLQRHEDICVFGSNKITYNPIMTTGKLRNKSGYTSSQVYDYGNTLPTKSSVANDQYYPTTILTYSNSNQKEKVHPTQKPIALLEYLVKTYSNEGETILDNCMGSGTTGVACVMHNRKFIGIEKDPTYFDIAKNRINTTQPYLSLDK